MSQVPAGWYTDPLDAAQRRYWDGAQWTHNTAPGAVTATGALGYGQVTNPTQAAPQAPAQAPAQANTVPAATTFSPAPARSGETFTPQPGLAPEVEVSPQNAQPAARFAPVTAASDAGRSPFGATPGAPIPTAYSPIRTYAAPPAQYSFANASPQKKRRGGTFAVLLVGGIIVIGGVGYLVNALVNSVAAPAVTETVALALDTSAKSDATSLGEELGLYYVDHGGPPPAITMVGGDYIIEIPDGTPVTVRASKGVVIGGVTGTGSSTWCVWVTAAEGALKDFQYGSTTGLVPGRC